MEIHSRRKFIRAGLGGAAVFAALPKSSLWAQSAEVGESFESELTGSVIEILGGDWSFYLENYEIIEDPEFTKEYLPVINQHSTLRIEFVQTSLAPEQYLEIVQTDSFRNSQAFEVVESGVTDDGAWFAASVTWEQISHSIYAEYQTGAFEEADLVVILNSRPDHFQQNIASVQQDILIGDFEPLLMVESSQVLALSFPVLTDETTTTTTNSRSSRSNQSSGEEETTNSRRGENQTNTTPSTDYPDAVLTHRTEFMGTFNQFAEALSVTMDDAATDADVSGAFATIDVLAEDWLGYPDRAAQLVAPVEYSSLEGLYITWADEIATLGSSYLGLYDGTSNVDTMFDQIDVVDQADRALVAELDAL